MDTNVVVLTGRLTADPVIRDAGETKVASFTLVFNKWRKKGEKFEEESFFFPCSTFGYGAEKAAERGKKGKRVTVTGTLEQRKWETDGQKREVTQINVRDATYHDFKAKGDGEGSGKENDFPF